MITALKSAWILLDVALVGALLTVADGAQAGILPSDAEVQKILADRVDALGGQAEGVGLVIGVVGPEGRKIFLVWRSRPVSQAAGGWRYRLRDWLCNEGVHGSAVVCHGSKG